MCDTLPIELWGKDPAMVVRVAPGVASITMHVLDETAQIRGVVVYEPAGHNGISGNPLWVPKRHQVLA